MKKQTILVTGGAGYIGSHTLVELLTSNSSDNDDPIEYEVVVVDNLVNSSTESLKRVEKITGKTVEFHHVDILDREALDAVFAKWAAKRSSSSSSSDSSANPSPPFDGVIHFAGLKAVGESQQMPLHYYHQNLTGTITLLQTMQRYGCTRIVFSSSATVYGEPELLPLEEGCRLAPANCYGRTKLFIEEMLRDQCCANPAWKVSLLRYFNPVGAHSSGMIGDDPQGIPNNLMPYVSQVAVGVRPHVNVFGDDYDTHDGTGVRDYIHVVDLARGHLAALRKMDEESFSGCHVYNLGTGIGYSVLDMIKAMSKACGHDIPYKIAPRRAGDVATSYANPAKATKELKWRAELTLDEMCRDLWKWQSSNPNGYRTN